MPKNTIDEILAEAIDRSVVGEDRANLFNQAKQALYQDLLELAKEYAKPVPADDEWHKAKYEKAIPVEALKQYFNVSEEK